VSPIDRADAYLTIPPGYGESLGGLRWAHRCDAIERPDGTTLVLAEEVRQLLEGVFSGPAIPPFAFVLNLYHLMTQGPDTTSVEFDRLWRAQTTARGAVGLRRNAGLLIAELCRELPTTPGAVTWPAVYAALFGRQLHGEHHRPGLAVEPPLPRAEFEQRIAARLRHLDDDALQHWLTHGCGPSGAGEKLAAPVESLPVRVARLIAEASKRVRLVGAAALVPALDAALTLPPRRRSPDALPQGGYCDVTNRGDPERLLPGQFALDPDEFVRRFAERELLYFKREEPHAAEKPERIVVLDQGVRTWGSVRLALAAAALTLLKKDAKRVGRVRLALTSTPDLIDVADADVETIADRLEASDLTLNPGGCLGRATSSESDPGPRDVVLLTQPRNLDELEVMAAARERRPGDRLLVLCVDERGRAELGEWTTRGRVPIQAFRVDLAAGEAARVHEEPQPPVPGSPSKWTGDVEPVPFPFRPGLVAEPTCFGFDPDGEWLVIAARDGILQGVALDGSAAEVLPRPFRDGVVLKQVDAVLGVTGGVVVCGRMKWSRSVTFTSNAGTLPEGVVLTSAVSDPAAPVRMLNADLFVAAHYDRSTRRVVLHWLGLAADGAEWSAYPDLQCVAVRTSVADSRVLGVALDLETFGRFPVKSDAGPVSRARLAWDRAAKSGSSPHVLPVQSGSAPSDAVAIDGPYLKLMVNALYVRQARPSWRIFEPQRDGKPLLDGATIYRSQLAGNVLAVGLSSSNQRQLVLFRGPNGDVLGELPYDHRDGPFALSADGRLLARRRPRDVEVTETANPAAVVATVPHAALHNWFWLWLSADPFYLTLRIGAFEHRFRLADGQLDHALVRDREWKAKPTAVPLCPPAADYDPARFPPGGEVAAGPWRMALDRLGQAVLYSRAGELIAAFLIRRERAAAWIPSGVYWGDPALIGGPPTPEAELKIGRAIQAAGGAP
jgi:hypothetical protein